MRELQRVRLDHWGSLRINVQVYLHQPLCDYGDNRTIFRIHYDLNGLYQWV